jgi:hypothetical protein
MFWLSATYQVSRFWKILYGVILILSQVSAVLIPLLYLSSRKCRHHPASIILILCKPVHNNKASSRWFRRTSSTCRAFVSPIC